MCSDSFLFPSNVTSERSVHMRRPSSWPNGWEVVQSVGLQTLDLAILVRVQASQPIMRRISRSKRSYFAISLLLVPRQKQIHRPHVIAA